MIVLARSLFRLHALCAALLALLIGAGAHAQPIRVGITQIVEHPSLNLIRQGFIDRLGELGYPEGTGAVYDIQSAHGEFATALTIAQKFLADNVDFVLAIATPSAQAAANVIREIPIIIAGVTDPIAAGLAESIARPGTNVTGTSDLPPVRAQLALLKELVPRVRRVGVIYNAGEVNSVVLIDLARKAAAELGITLVEATVGSTAEVQQAAQSLLGRVDAIYVQNDNTTASAIEAVIAVAERGRLPLITSDDTVVEKGALGTIGIDYYELGRRTADVAYRVLQGEQPADIPIERIEGQNIFLNLDVARRLGVTIPDEMTAKAVRIFGEP